MAQEMKDSGIMWVGKIPANWNIRRNKTLFSCSKEIVGEQSISMQLLSLTTQGIRKKSKTDVSGKVPESYNTYQIVKPDDIVMCLFDLDCSAVFSGISYYSGMISPAYKAGSPVKYTQTETFEAYREKYQSYYSHIDYDIQRPCSCLQQMKTSKAERVATLLAAWNDFVIQGIVPTNNQLVQEVRSNWTPNKAHSSESTWLGTLAEMKAHKIIPSGYGKCTVHMK